SGSATSCICCRPWQRRVCSSGSWVSTASASARLLPACLSTSGDCGRLAAIRLCSTSRGRPKERRLCGRPPRGGLLFGHSAIPLQRLPTLGSVGAAVLVHVAAREVALGLGHELLQGHNAVLVGVEALEIARLALDLPVGGQHAVADRRRAREQLVLGELAVAVGVELLEPCLLARLPLGTVDHAVLVGVVAHDAAVGAGRPVGGGRRSGRVAGGGEGGAGKEQGGGGNDQELQHADISL